MSMPCIISSQTNRCHAMSDLVLSIALEKCALSHILNAEGETLQKVLCFHNLSIDDVVTTNKSVVEVVKIVCDLEREMREKLHLFRGCFAGDYCYGDDDNDHDHHHNHCR